MIKSLRPSKKYNYIFPKLKEDVSPQEIIEWRMEIEELWEGWTVTWHKVGDREFAISCEPKNELLGLQ